jgi:hypothetical protein
VGEVGGGGGGGGGDVDNSNNYNNNLWWGKPTLEAPHVLCLGNTNDHSFCWLPLPLNVPDVSNGNVMNYICVLTPSDHNIHRFSFFTAGISEREGER